MKLKIYIVLTIIFLIPFVMNICGKSIYLYVNVGEKDLVFASVIGIFHCAYADKLDFMEASLSLGELDYGGTEIIKSERINK